MNRGDILLTVVQLLGGAVVGYLFGLKQGRKQTQYDRKAAAITELRQMLREIQDCFVELSARPEFRLDEWPNRREQAKALGEKLDMLENYYKDQAAGSMYVHWRSSGKSPSSSFRNGVPSRMYWKPTPTRSW
jgi:hypothetical protein